MKTANTNVLNHNDQGWRELSKHLQQAQKQRSDKSLSIAEAAELFRHKKQLVGIKFDELHQQ